MELTTTVDIDEARSVARRVFDCLESLPSRLDDLVADLVDRVHQP